MKKVITAALLMVASLEMFGQMVWISEELYRFDYPNQFFSTQAGQYLISYGGGIKLVNSEGIEVLELVTSGVFPGDGSHSAYGVLEMYNSTFAVGTYSYGADPMSGAGWAYSSIIQFDQSGHGTLLATDFYHPDYGSLEASLLDGSYVVLYPYGNAQIVVKGPSGEVVQEIGLPGVFDVLAIPDDSLVVATKLGLAVMDRFGSVANTYPDFIFKSIKSDGLGRIVGVAESTITLLSPDYQLLTQVVLTGEEVKDFAVEQDTVAILTTSNMVKLYSGELSFFHEFQLTGNERYRYIAMNKGWIALAGEEVYGDVPSNQYSTTSFIKEYSVDGTTTTFTEDIGITDIDLGDSVVIEPTGFYPGHYWVYFPNVEITVHNYGPTPVDRFYLHHLDNNPVFNEVTIMPDGEVAVPWPSFRKLETNGYPSGMTVEVCAWTSKPNLTFDTDADNDLFCTDFLVNDEDVLTSNSLELFPNPAHEMLNLQWEGHIASNDAICRILNLEGRVIKTMEIDHQQGMVSIPVKNWPSGMYFIQISDNAGLSYSKKFLVIK